MTMIQSVSCKNRCLPRIAAMALMALASTALTGPVFSAEFPAVIALSSLDGRTGFRLDGVAAANFSGSSVASAGDVNGDGFADVIVGAHRASPHGSYSGSSYVVFGKASGFSAAIDLSSLNGTNGFRLEGVAALDYSGGSVASAGDVNGDGFADVIVGAFGADPHGDRSGSSYVVFGKASRFNARIALSRLDGVNGFRLDGVAASDYSGGSVASAGDVNGDGFADVIIGASGADPQGSIYVVFGKAAGFASAIDLSSLDGTNGFRLDGAALSYGSGFSVASAGDINGDGFDDVIVGAPRARLSAYDYNRGSSYVVFGRAAGFAPAINLSGLDGANGFRLNGRREYDYCGWSVASAGDVNGDGFADVIVGVIGANPRGESFGSSYVVFGKASGFAPAINLAFLDAADGFSLSTVLGGDGSGRSAGSAGDVNGDGFADMIVGAPGADPHGDNSGASYVVFGKALGLAPSIRLYNLDGGNGFRLDGVAEGDISGLSVAGAGDVNGDGFADAIVGARLADPHGDRSGSSYVVFGRAPDSARRRIGGDASQHINGGRFNDTLNGRGGNDRTEGREGADILVGGPGRDAASYAHAKGPVTADLALPANNTGEAAGDSYTAIENVTGSSFNDRLTGDRFANWLTGNKGADLKTGGGGPDVFAYRRLDDSAPGSATRDRIADFNAGTATTVVDRINLSMIDAQTGPGNQAFTFIGQAPFTLGVKGQLRAVQAGSSVIVEGDTNGDQTADIQIVLTNFSNLAGLTASDFIR